MMTGMPAGLRAHVRRRSSAGFSLLEVMIGLSVLTIALVSIGSFMLRLNSVSGDTFAQSLARSYAVELLEELRRQPYSQLDDIPAGEIEGSNGFIRSASVNRVGAATSLEDYKIITVEVRPPGKAKSVRLTAAISGA